MTVWNHGTPDKQNPLEAEANRGNESSIPETMEAWIREYGSVETWTDEKRFQQALDRINKHVNKAVMAALAKHVLAGMPELTPRQQAYITKVLEAKLFKGEQ